MIGPGKEGRWTAPHLETGGIVGGRGSKRRRAGSTAPSKAEKGDGFAVKWMASSALPFRRVPSGEVAFGAGPKGEIPLDRLILFAYDPSLGFGCHFVELS